MTSIENEARVYSQDRKIWVGMQTADANKTEEDMKIFNFADYDGNGEISKSEVDRYNGPLLVENFPERKGRIIGHVGLRSLSALYIADNEVDYYPGLKIESVDKAGRVVYNRIDSNHDSQLSTKEMEDVVKVKEKIDETTAKLDSIANKRSCLTALGVAGGLLGACVSCLSTGSDALFLNNGLSTKQGWLFAGLSIATGVGLSILNNHVAKSKAQKEIEKLQNETNNHQYLNDHLSILRNIV